MSFVFPFSYCIYAFRTMSDKDCQFLQSLVVATFVFISNTFTSNTSLKMGKN